ncbi:Protein TWIN LOV 1 [Quillaja saponaria]|uniref:Protein TWIN LOV 1 n=1 Tax=Quillaja saponaria TaxID=32244 RepID=A0AAD7L8S8_QUISA|nr:Protein TWIN LOV 1 [Quillaja saponaria]
MESQLSLIEQSFHNRYSLYVREALEELSDNFTITDPCIPGHPIVFASRGFLKMSGYSMDEVIGKNGRIFQGPGTCRRSVMKIREAIREEITIQINLLNYRKDGTPFWLLFHMCPVFSKDDGRVINFVGVQVPILGKPRRSGVRASALDSVLQSDSEESEAVEPCEASDLEKRRAMSAINNIFSVLTHYSESTGRSVCRKRCSIPQVGLLSSSLNISLGRIKQSFVLTNPYLTDMPIVYASDAFLKMTGYARDEVLGRNCRFLSGMDTDTSTLYQVRESIQTEQPCTVRILNYRKDKSSFWTLLHVSPVRGASGKIAYFVEVQTEEGCNSEERHGLSPEKRQLSVVGAIKVAVRSLSMVGSTSKS